MRDRHDGGGDTGLRNIYNILIGDLDVEFRATPNPADVRPDRDRPADYDRRL